MIKTRQNTGRNFLQFLQVKLTLKVKLTVLFLVTLTLLFPSRTEAWGGSDFPSLDVFIEELSNGEPDDLRGIYAPGLLADEIVYQPTGEPTYISSLPNMLTVFGMAAQYETIGLLAHNTLAGQDFPHLETGQVVYLIYGDGRLEAFAIREFLRYQALEPQSTTSDFVDLETGESLSASQLFLKIFDRPGFLILQTCIFANGDNSWGRLFIIAEPLGSAYFWSMPNKSRVRYY